MPDSKKNVRDLRRQHNVDLIRRMRNGEPLNSIDSKASWYPPRPVIEKDRREMARLYGDSVATVTARPTNGPVLDKKVVQLAPLGQDPVRKSPLDEAS